MKRVFTGLMLATAIACILLTGAQAHAQQRQLADDYLAALLAPWEELATIKDAEKLVSMFSEDAVNEHPRIGMRIEGRDKIAEGMARFLGTSRAPAVAGLQVISGRGVLVLGLDLETAVRATDKWTGVERRQVIVQKHFIDGQPGSILDGPQRDFCRD